MSRVVCDIGVLQDRDSAGHLLVQRYPSGERQVEYSWDHRGRLVTVYHDWTDITFSYNDDDNDGSEAVREATVVSLAGDPYNCQVSYERSGAGPLLTAQRVSFSAGSPAFVGAEFHYSYDLYFRPVSVEVTVGGRVLPTQMLAYEDATGRLRRSSPFVFDRPHPHRELTRDVNVEIVREFDTRGRMTDVWYRFNNHVVFTVETKYTAVGRVHQWRRKVRSSDLKAYEHVYDVDGTLVEVLENGQSTWRYETDSDGGLITVAHYATSRAIVVDRRGAVTSAGDFAYVFDADGFLSVRGDAETFEWDSLGRLTRAHRDGLYDIRYLYDALGRLIVRQDVSISSSSSSSSSSVVQFFYGDARYTDRITHVYNSTSSDSGTSRVGVVIRYFYDDSGRLFAMQHDDDEMYYIGLDPFGTPLVVLNGVGSVVRQLGYDPLGDCLTDSAPGDSTARLLAFGYHGGLVDWATRLVMFDAGRRVYDPLIGRLLAPEYQRIVDDVGRLTAEPLLISLYHNERLWTAPALTHDSPVTGQHAVFFIVTGMWCPLVKSFVCLLRNTVFLLMVTCAIILNYFCESYKYLLSFDNDTLHANADYAIVASSAIAEFM